ncbi:MAG: rhomboid family intramembrane serine protease, partial [Anaerolineaceae bacterium]|nr:rhomboid family intramembrane serine protease [Anaerolineaceae bacterium]
MNFSPPPSPTDETPGAPPPSPPVPPADQPPRVTLRLPARRLWLVYTIIALTVGVYLLQTLSQLTLGGVDYPALLGAKFNDLIRQGQYWRLFTPMLLHGSIIHVGFNMYALFIIGRGLERYYGSRRLWLLYLLAGFAGNVVSFLFSLKPSLGASTAVFGLVAAQGVFVYRNRFLFGANARPLLINIATIVAINLFLGLSPGIDNWGHLGGLLGGLAFSWFAGPVFTIEGVPPVMHLEDRRRDIQAFWVALGAGLILSLIVWLSLR